MGQGENNMGRLGLDIKIKGSSLIESRLVPNRIECQHYFQIILINLLKINCLFTIIFKQKLIEKPTKKVAQTDGGGCCSSWRSAAKKEMNE
jgi:hypothetical protein